MQTMRLLPKGRHSLSREQVEASQRTRLLRAAVELGNERGFASLTLTDIVHRAGVARSTFYEYFADKQQCYLAAFDYAADRVLESVLALKPLTVDEFTAPIHAYIGRFLDLCLQEPDLARLIAADAGALGPAAVERQREIRGRIADALVKLRDFLHRDTPALVPITHIRALAVVGAITEVLQHTFHTSGIDALSALQPELSTIVLALLEAPSSEIRQRLQSTAGTRR